MARLYASRARPSASCSFKAAPLPIKQMQNFEALFLPHPDAAERFRVCAPRLALADMPDELLRYVYARTRVASAPRVLHVVAPHLDRDEALRLADDARIIVISTNLGRGGKHPASRLKLRVWLDQEVIFSLPVPRNDNDEPGFVSVTGPSSAHDARHMIVECAISDALVYLWVGQFAAGVPAYFEDFIFAKAGHGENEAIVTRQNLEGTSVRVTCSPS